MTTTKLFRCPYCDVAFVARPNLTRHLQFPTRCRRRRVEQSFTVTAEEIGVDHNIPGSGRDNVAVVPGDFNGNRFSSSSCTSGNFDGVGPFENLTVSLEMDGDDCIKSTLHNNRTGEDGMSIPPDLCCGEGEMTASIPCSDEGFAIASSAEHNNDEEFVEIALENGRTTHISLRQLLDGTDGNVIIHIIPDGTAPSKTGFV